ncbi:hypothetical protein [Lelliottia wanjuensis]|uniref:hypothetical protein n=1 Tax=Lelliottia wanjuensis TaxID=3050585 RepID=UPI002549E5FA|nr:hypothetical protein [Lelliottia sp. V86_10]MDK9583170.1 hypothetical protein [Lelliottia sp. V86_10]
MGLLGGMGAGKAAEAQAKAAKEIAKGFGQLGQKQYDWISPWMDAGKGALTAQMQMLANPLNSQAALTDYYAGPQYAQQEAEAQYATESAAEATGTMGSTATGNVLASQSTQLGQQYLQGLNKQRSQQFQELGGISQEGLSATKTMGNWGYQDVSSAAKYLGEAAGLSGAGTMAKYSGLAGGISSAIKTASGLFGANKAGGANKSPSGDTNWWKVAGDAAMTALSFL